MYVDAITLTALSAELTTLLGGGRVQSVLAPDSLSVGLEVYANSRRHYLLLTAAPKAARVHLVSDKLRRGVEKPSTLHLLLRKYVEGARLAAVSQPPWERILHLDFSGPEGDTRLIAELMDQRSNLILTVEGDILEALRRIGPNENRARIIQPGKPYVPPPPQDKIVPESATPAKIAALLAAGPDLPAWRALVDAIAGISPLVAREIIHRACGDALSPAFDLAPEIVYRALADLLAEVGAGRWSPCVIPAAGGEGYRAFAAYTLTHLGDSIPVQSISEAMSTYFGAPVGEDAYAGAKTKVQAEIEKAMERARRKLAALDRELAQTDQIETLRKSGELILAYGSTLTHGQQELSAQYDPDGPALRIALDADLSASQNARRYFDRYDKAKRAIADLPALRIRAEREAAYLDQLLTDLDLAENWPEIDAVRDELRHAGYGQLGRPGSGKPGIRRVVTPDGFVILVGRNAEQSHKLITTKAAPQDVWLHVRDKPGGHVIIRNDGRPIPETVVERAAGLAAYYSAGRGEAQVEVDVTERRHVRPIKGARPGMVTHKQGRVVTVKPEK